MKILRSGNPVLLTLTFVGLMLIPTTLLSQERVKSSEFQPEVGQEGKDVVWVPTPQALVDKMLDLAKITPEDFLIDLGSGDGRTVITAAQRGTKAIGIEYNPDMVELSRRKAKEAGVSDKAQFINTDLFEYDFSKATVITMFLLPDINLRLRPKILDMKPGTRIVSNTFTMQDWRWDDSEKIDDNTTNWTTAFLWIVPAKVNGKWTLSGGGDLDIHQEFQKFTGELIRGREKTTITDGLLRGNNITFHAGNTVYTGLVSGNRIEGTFESNGKKVKWSATR
jgi:hypothetical protein